MLQKIGLTTKKLWTKNCKNEENLCIVQKKQVSQEQSNKS